MSKDCDKSTLTPERVAQAIRDAVPQSDFEKAMWDARGFHRAYEGELSTICLTPLSPR